MPQDVPERELVEEALKKGLEDALPEARGEAEGVVDGVVAALAVPLLARVPEAAAEAVPRRPCAVALWLPLLHALNDTESVPLELPVPHPLKEAEGVVEVDSEPVAERLALGVMVLLPEAQGEGDPEAHWLLEGVPPMTLPVGAMVPVMVGEAEKRALGESAALSEGVA